MPSNKNDKVDDYVPYPVNGEQLDNEKKSEGILSKASHLLGELKDGIVENAPHLAGGNKKKEEAESPSSNSLSGCSGWNCPRPKAFSERNVAGAGEVFKHPEKFNGKK